MYWLTEFHSCLAGWCALLVLGGIRLFLVAWKALHRFSTNISIHCHRLSLWCAHRLTVVTLVTVPLIEVWSIATACFYVLTPQYQLHLRGPHLISRSHSCFWNGWRYFRYCYPCNIVISLLSLCGRCISCMIYIDIYVYHMISCLFNNSIL